MPWIKQEICDGCTTCVGQCPATAISIREHMKAWIHDDRCIHCGTCQEVCPKGAARPDHERLPSDVEANVRKVKSLMQRRHNPCMREKSLRCVVDYYETQRRLAETTLRKLAVLYGHTATSCRGAGRTPQKKK
ncbi:MAG TPA: ferredoxin [Elusimicrobia bacterium]|nr:ferredoxin [Elusimicrobiota bacterium]HBT62918.1 ferredoxin [Elusimicrobiota bacterium]